MENTIGLRQWFEVIDTEYLSTFIPQGGASVKFAVTPEHLDPALYGTIEARCAALDHLVVRLDARTMRAHMPQDLFFEMARQLDWRTLARRSILVLASQEGYAVEGIDPKASGVYEAIAEANNHSPGSVRQDLRPELQRHIRFDAAMAKDFRVCMSHLCLREFVRHEYTAQPLLDWLTGENLRISAVKDFSIAGGINRTTARYFIESSLHWIRKAGFAGTVVLFDNRRVTLSRNPKDGNRYYTRAMALDHYELLREFVDGVDRLSGALMLVVTSKEFLNPSEERRSRGYGIYQALRTRVMDDVRDSKRANPVASLVELSEEIDHDS
ncbi:MAG: DUF2791 family P-loop domain-containing protein [bacterium]|nr:DUF2791 family P-loop domain-containing protein [bacterium]MCY3953654.1 DUF2791 family P-loop domain-containing protein [bacterium]MCY4103265.1 DUF2791 family P-loop domain-containing protein [bacterium]